MGWEQDFKDIQRKMLEAHRDQERTERARDHTTRRIRPATRQPSERIAHSLFEIVNSELLETPEAYQITRLVMDLKDFEPTAHADVHAYARELAQRIVEYAERFGYTFLGSDLDKKDRLAWNLELSVGDDQYCFSIQYQPKNKADHEGDITACLSGDIYLKIKNPHDSNVTTIDLATTEDTQTVNSQEPRLIYKGQPLHPPAKKTESKKYRVVENSEEAVKRVKDKRRKSGEHPSY